VGDPYRELSKPSRACPRCGFALSPRVVLDARLDECPSCEGLFVSRELLPRFLDPLDLGGEVLATFPSGSPEVTNAGPMYVKCPLCHGVMNRRQFAVGAKVVVDICRDHGVWFDALELRAVAAFAQDGGMERAAAIEARRREKEKADMARDVAAMRLDYARHTDPRRERYVALIEWMIGLFR